ncbi:MAG TPA: ABC transporter permease [Jatrophihabitans sp.]|nr:ABC transporter permease [Jatrophihabitans sp.]
MPWLILKRLAFGIPLVFAVSAVTFCLVALAPGDAARVTVGPNATPEQYAAVRAQLGLDQSLPEQYWHWLSHAVRGDLGRSILSGQPVSGLLDQRLGVTLSVILLATALAAVVGIALGALSAQRRGVVGKAIDAGSLLGFAIPNYWLGLLLVAVFAVQWRMFPAVGYVDFAVSPGQWLHSLVLPVVTLAVGGAAGIAKVTRDAMLSTLDQEFVTAYRADGVAERTIVFRHVLRNSAPPILSMIGLFFIGSLGGTVLVEQVFSLPGLGGLAVSSASQHDIPVIQGIAVYFTLLVVAVNLLLDLLYGWLNPKARIA